jgi:hypothetical protein
MEEKQVITSLGYILKREKLATLASQKNYGELILEDLDPFPGFYDHYFVPANENEKKPRSIFLIVKDLDICKEDTFIRMTMHIKREHSIKFDAAMAIVQLFNKSTPCIRIFMDDYELLPELISHYRKVGMGFLPKKDIKPFQTLIEVRKYFEVKALSDGIYMDMDQIDTYYLRVPSYLTWDQFESVTIGIRNNMSHKLYDAAQAAIYEKKGIVDLIRIFDRKTDLEKLEVLRQKYISEIERM